MRKADVSDLRSDVRFLPAMNEFLPARLVREKAIQRLEIVRLSAGISRSCPCNLAESPCISLMSRERRVGLGLLAQPPHKLLI